MRPSVEKTFGDIRATGLCLVVAVSSCVNTVVRADTPVYERQFTAQTEDITAVGATVMTDTDDPGRKWVLLQKGDWEDRAIDVRPFEFYRASLQTRMSGRGFWRVRFYRADGTEIAADYYTGIGPCPRGETSSSVFMTRADTATMRFGLAALDGPLQANDIRIERVSREEAIQWADDLYATLPPVAPALDADGQRFLDRTMRTLRAGKTLRVVVLGDSIANDMCNSLFHLQLERFYPGSKVVLIPSVRGGTGCAYYREENRVVPYVVDHEPDLLVIAGISNGHDSDAIFSVVRQVRERIDVEVIILTGAIAPKGKTPEQRTAAMAENDSFFDGLKDLANTEHVAVFNLYRHWDDYVRDSGRTHESFLRDSIHGNDSGRQIAGRLFAEFFRPAAGGNTKPVARKDGN